MLNALKPTILSALSVSHISYPPLNYNFYGECTISGNISPSLQCPGTCWARSFQESDSLGRPSPRSRDRVAHFTSFHGVRRILDIDCDSVVIARRHYGPWDERWVTLMERDKSYPDCKRFHWNNGTLMLAYSRHYSVFMIYYNVHLLFHSYCLR